MKPLPLYQEIANKLQAIENCKESGNHDWQQRHTSEVLALVKARMPSGAGFDCGTALDMKESTPERLVFNTSYHHMDDNGSYSHWTEHTIVVTASLVFDINLEITGITSDLEDNGFGDYIYDAIHYALTEG